MTKLLCQDVLCHYAADLTANLAVNKDRDLKKLAGFGENEVFR